MICMRATNRRAVCLTANDVLTTGSVGIPVQFAFDAAWDGLSKIAVFRAGDVSVDVLLSGDSCTVPPEVLVNPGNTLLIGVYGTDGTGAVVIPTIYADAGLIVKGAVPSGVEPTEQTPPLIDQLLAAATAAWTAAQAAQTAAQAAETLAQSVRDDADNGAFDGAPGAAGPVGPAGADGTKGDKGDKGDTGPQGPAYELTNADKSTITAAVLAALPTWTGGNY